MQIIKVARKCKNLDSLEKYHICCTFKQNKHFNEIHTDNYNPIFDKLFNHYHEYTPPIIYFINNASTQQNTT
jgi:hypothetical protein